MTRRKTTATPAARADAASVSPLYDRAMAAVPGLDRVSAAREQLQIRGAARDAEAQRTRQLVDRNDLIREIGSQLMQGKPMPDDAGTRLHGLRVRAEELDAENRLLVGLGQWVGQQSDMLIADGVDAAFDVLRAELDDIVTTARAAAADLGEVRSAEEAIDAGGTAAEALRAVRQLAERYRTLRSVQLQIARAAVTTSLEARPRTPGDGASARVPWWGMDTHDRAHGRNAIDAVTALGRYASDVPVVEPDDPVQLIVQLVDPDRPRPQVTPLDEVRERTEAEEAAARKRKAADRAARTDGRRQPEQYVSDVR